MVLANLPVLFKVVYVLTCGALSLIVLVFLGDPTKDAELLRHGNAVLRRQVGRVRRRAGGPGLVRHAGMAGTAKALERGLPMTPAALLAWHRKLTARKYDTSKRRRPGCPPANRSNAHLRGQTATNGSACEMPASCPRPGRQGGHLSDI